MGSLTEELKNWQRARAVNSLLPRRGPWGYSVHDARREAEASARRRPVPHVYACPECYQGQPCGLGCAIVGDLDGLPAGDICVCGLCLLRAGLPTDEFMTALPVMPRRGA
jgi:hypothetical protein